MRFPRSRGVQSNIKVMSSPTDFRVILRRPLSNERDWSTKFLLFKLLLLCAPCTLSKFPLYYGMLRMHRLLVPRIGTIPSICV